ncbi:MAG: hypothetical protein U0V74_16990 [Chitinophagales bacterium]
MAAGAIKLVFYLIAGLISLVTFIAVKIRNARNKSHGKGLIAALKSDTADIDAIKQDTVWKIAEKPLTEIDLNRFAHIEGIQEVSSVKGCFKVEHIKFLNSKELLIATFGENTGYENATLELYLYLIRVNSDTGKLEIKATLFTDLNDKSFKRDFAESILGMLSI